MKKKILLYIALILILVSCRTVDSVSPAGMRKIRKYDFSHPDIPKAFDGFRIAFATDFHYKSKFKEKQLREFVKTVNQLHPDLLLLGGDYQEGCHYVPELASYLSEIIAPSGKFGVMGNNDYQRCYNELIREFSAAGISILEHQNDTISLSNEFIIVSGVRNPFDLQKNGKSPTLSLSPEDFVILLTHTPDYAEDVDISNTDMALAGHTHGGQVTLFGLYAPVTQSKYGQRFRTGKKKTSSNVPIFISNGLGTSRKNIRLFAPTDIILIVLHSAN